MSKTHTYRTGLNKGHARIWIEGKRLTDAGWSNGDRFDKAINDAGQLRLTRNPEGRHKIAGTDKRPIIDLCGQWVTDWADGAEEYHVTFAKNLLNITKG